MNEQFDYFMQRPYELLAIALPQYIGKCFTYDEVRYMLGNLKYAMDLDEFMFDPTVYQHMYDRFPLVHPDFKEAWDAVENCKSQDELVAIEEKYNVSARMAMLVMDVRLRTFDWREEFPTPKSGH